MQMKMLHTLPRIVPSIGDDAISLSVETMLPGELRGKGKHAPEQLLALSASGITNRRNVSGWDDQQVNRRLGIDIPEGQSLV